MSATYAGALKGWIEGAGLGLAAYRDRAPDGEPFPYVTITDGVSTVFELHGDFGDPYADRAVSDLVQVDLWERLKGSTAWHGDPTAPVEEPFLIRGLLEALHGARLGTTAPALTFAVIVDNATRLVEEDRGVVHTAITLRVRHALASLADT